MTQALPVAELSTTTISNPFDHGCIVNSETRYHHISSLRHKSSSCKKPLLEHPRVALSFLTFYNSPTLSIAIMPFRSKLKRALGGGGGGNGTSETSSLNKTDSKASKKAGHEKSNLPDNVYKPGEPMPRPKYRGPWNQAHQDKLSAFRFGSFSSSRMSEGREERRKRRSSAQASDYSPMGSKLPSRGPSQAPSRRGSAWSAFSGGSGSKRRAMGSRRQTQQRGGDDGLEEAAEGDTDVANGAFSTLFLPIVTLLPTTFRL